MKISFNWLKQYLDFDVSLEDTLRILTELGLEVDGYSRLGQDPEKLAALVVGEVVSCEKHPNADKLKLTQVTTDGSNRLSIVCGAPNVALGQKVVVAPVGATLHPTSGESFKIQKAKIRGEVSEGMLCAEDEIGIGHSHAGIMVLPADSPVGAAFTDVFPVDFDYEIEIGLTPNRSDAISHYGVARDLAAYYRKKAVLPEVPALVIQADPADAVQLTIEDAAGCSRFTGLSIQGVKIGPSPVWLQNRLKSIGHNPINNVVDVTNFVMFELGQPLHAYDMRQIEGKQIRVRFARPGEKITLLNKQAYTLDPANLLICHASQPMGVAGVMGGLHDSIQADTTSIYLESAHFEPSVIRKSSKLLGIKSDASYRFERGTDPHITVLAIQRAAALILEVAGGKISSELQDVVARKPVRKELHLLYPNVDRIIGTKIKRESIKEILLCLDFEILHDYGDSLTLVAPDYRVDVTREIDVIEEILRIYGLNKVDNGERIRYNRSYPLRNSKNDWQQTLSDQLVSLGYHESMSLSFIGDKQLALLPSMAGKEVRVLNPVNEEVPVMRPSLLFNGLQNIQHNANRRNSDLHLFEFGKVYFKQNKSRTEQEVLALWACGQQHSESWYQTTRKVDFYHTHAALRSLLQRCGVLNHCETAEASHDLLSYGLSYIAQGKVLAQVGSIAPAALKMYDLKQEVFYAEVDWALLLRLAANQNFKLAELSRFPSVRRDLALVIDKSVTYRALESLAKTTVGALLTAMNLFDVYEGEKLGAGKRSYAISFVFEDKEKTMTESDIEAVMQKLMTKFEVTLAATVRQ